MTARILYGRPVADRIRDALVPEIAEFRQANGIAPTLAVVRVGNAREAVSYALSIDHIFTESGMGFQVHVLPENISEEQLISSLDDLTRADDIYGILLQRPLPDVIDERRIMQAFPVLKDVEGVTPSNLGKLASDSVEVIPTSTPSAAIEILSHYGIPVVGLRALVIGRSAILGKPMALLLLQAGATVMVAHSHSRDLADLVREAELLVVAAGHPKLVDGTMIKPGATVVDFGVNVQENLICGDVDFESARAIASAITPVPGGTGPVSTMQLMRNTVHMAQKQVRQIGAKGRIKWLPILRSPNRRQ